MVDAETVRKRINEMMLEVSDSGEDFLRTLLEEYLDELGVELGIEFDSSAVLVELGLAPFWRDLQPEEFVLDELLAKATTN